MSAPSELPEGLLRYLLERLLPKDLKGEAIQGDLLEEFRARAELSSHREARARYRRQSRRILWAMALGRISRAERKAGVPVRRASVGSILAVSLKTPPMHSADSGRLRDMPRSRS